MKMIFFDFDGTLTKKSNEIWRNIWKSLDALDVDDRLYTQYANGELTPQGWCDEITKEFIKRNLNTSTLDNLIKDIKMMDNLESTLIKLKSKGYNLYILSGGIDYVIYSLLGEKKKYFNKVMSTKFHFDENGYLTKIEDTDSDQEGKANTIKKYLKETNSLPDEVIFIGNSDNDEFVYKTGCHTICINPNKTNHKDKSIWNNYIYNTDNLEDILKIIEKIENSNSIK